MIQKKNIVIIGIGLIAAIIFGATILSTQNDVLKDDGKIIVAATIFPLYDMVQTVAKGGVDVALIVPEGSSPHTFTVTPSKIKELSKASSVFMIGGVDDWASVIVESLPSAYAVPMSEGVSLRFFEEEGLDPHYWLSTENAQRMVVTILDELVRIDPENSDLYIANTDVYLQELASLHEVLTITLGSAKHKDIIVFHDSWGYFAEAYNVNIAGVFEMTPGVEPLASDLVRITDVVENSNISTIFIEPQLSGSVVDAIANDLDLQVVTLDPLGGVPGRTTYLDMMRYNGEVIYQALQ